MSVYIAFMQYELFACFLFISEFIILLFFYVLFLNLNLKIKLFNTSYNMLFNFNILIIIALTLILYYSFIKTNFFLFNMNELYLNFYNIFKLNNDLIVNDLVFFYHMLFHYNVVLFLLVAFILVIMTFVLLYFTLIYHFIVTFQELILFSIQNPDQNSNQTSKTLLLKFMYNVRMISLVRNFNFKPKHKK